MCDGDDSVRLDAQQDECESRRGAGRIPERRRCIVVERGEAARREAGEEVRDPGGHDPAKRVGGGVPRDAGPVACEHLGEPAGPEPREEE